jgi:hypothetical protein
MKRNEKGTNLRKERNEYLMVLALAAEEVKRERERESIK